MLSEGFREKLSAKYLDFAERLPKGKISVVTQLQSIREHQRRSANSNWEKTQPPDGCDADFIMIRIFEHYSIEMVDALAAWLLQLLPGLKGGPTQRDFGADLRSQTSSYLSQKWWNLGALLSATTTGMYNPNQRIFEHMPESIEAVQIALYQVLPSSFALVFDMHLTQGASSRLRCIRDAKHLPEVILSQIIPRGIVGFSSLDGWPSSAIRRAVSQELDEIQLQLLRALPALPRGTFRSHSRKSTGLLPHVFLVSMTGVPTDRSSLTEWEKHARSWWESLSLDLQRDDIFYDGNSLLSFPERGEKPFASAAQLIVFIPGYIHQKEQVGHQDTRRAIKEHARYTLDEVQPLLVVHELLNVLEQQLSDSRYSVSVCMNSPGWRSLFLQGLFMANERLSVASMLLGRLAIEFKNLSIGGHFTDISGYHLLRQERGQEGEPLVAVTKERISWRVGVLQQYAEFTESALSRLVQLRNTSATYALTVFVAILAVVALAQSGFFHPVATWVSQFIQRIMP